MSDGYDEEHTHINVHGEDSSNAQAPELKPCPFCGGCAEKISRFDVKCSGCGAEINSLHLADDAWNTRTDPAKDAMREAFGDLLVSVEAYCRALALDMSGSEKTERYNTMRNDATKARAALALDKEQG